MKGLPTGYNKDLQEDKEAVFDVRGHARGLAARGPRRGVEADRQRRTLRPRGVGSAAGHRRRRLSRDPRHAVPPRPRSGGQDGAVAAGAGARLQRPDPRGVARRERACSAPDAPQAATALASVQARKTPQSTNPEAVQAAVLEHRRVGGRPLGTWELTLLDCRHPRSLPYPTSEGTRSGGIDAATPASAR